MERLDGPDPSRLSDQLKMAAREGRFDVQELDGPNSLIYFSTINEDSSSVTLRKAETGERSCPQQNSDDPVRPSYFFLDRSTLPSIHAFEEDDPRVVANWKEIQKKVRKGWGLPEVDPEEE